MDPPQFGESSRSPQQRAAALARDSHVNGTDTNFPTQSNVPDMSRLILGNWDVLPPKRIHASHDLISLLHLDSLYNTYVRPFADAIGPEEDGVKDEAGEGMQIDGEGDMPLGAGGKKRKKTKKAKLEKGYIHLIDDCIDPTPLGEHKDKLAILPLIPDQLDPSLEYPPPDFGPRPMMLDTLWDNARLEAGQVVDGYSEGVKKGVKENEEKRQRKRQQRQAQASSAIPTGLPSPALVSPYDRIPGTPLQPIAPPRPPFNLSTARKPFIPSRPGVPGTPGGRFVPGTPGIRPPGTPGTPRIRLGSGSGPTLIPAPGSGSVSTPHGLPPRPMSANPNKRPGDTLSAINPKRTKPVGGSRSASPMPGSYGHQGATPMTPTAPPQGRPGIGKQPRSRTEGA